MSKIKALAVGAKALVSTGVSTIKTHSPLIMVVAGIGCGIAAAVTACKATTKVGDILDGAKEDIETVDYALEHPEEIKDGEVYTEEDAKTDRKIIKMQTGKTIAKTYALTAILGASSIALILGGYHILHGRNVAITSAFNATTAAFAKYRERVIAEQGEIMDRHFRYGTKLKKHVDVDPETGEETVSYTEEPAELKSAHGFHFVGDINPALCWDYCRETSPNFYQEFDRRPRNISDLEDAEEWAKNELKNPNNHGVFWAYKLCNVLGLDENEISHDYGWLAPETDEEKAKWPELSIGIHEWIEYMLHEKHVTGYDLYHADSIPIAMNAWNIRNDPRTWERINRGKPFASLTVPGAKFKGGRKVPSFLYATYTYNNARKKAKMA